MNIFIKIKDTHISVDCIQRVTSDGNGCRIYMTDAKWINTDIPMETVMDKIDYANRKHAIPEKVWDSFQGSNSSYTGYLRIANT